MTLTYRWNLPFAFDSRTIALSSLQLEVIEVYGQYGSTFSYVELCSLCYTKWGKMSIIEFSPCPRHTMTKGLNLESSFLVRKRLEQLELSIKAHLHIKLRTLTTSTCFAPNASYLPVLKTNWETYLLVQDSHPPECSHDGVLHCIEQSGIDCRDVNATRARGFQLECEEFQGTRRQCYWQGRKRSSEDVFQFGKHKILALTQLQ